MSGELALMLPVIGETMALAAQSLRQSSALASLLIAKGLLTQKELDATFALTPDPAKILAAILQGIVKQPD
jgi:hypothetical protein